MNVLLLVLCLLVGWVTSSEAAIRYVSTSGTNTSCSGATNIATPARTFAFVKACMSPGDTMYIRAGTYSEQLDVRAVSGSAGLPLTFAGYPGERPCLTAKNGQGGFAIYGPYDPPNNYIVIRNLLMDGTCDGTALASLPDNTSWSIGNVNAGGSPHDILIDDIEIRFWRGIDLFIAQGSTNVTIQNSKLHDAQTTYSGNDCGPITPSSQGRYYGIYAHDTVNLLIQNNEINDNVGGGIQIYPGPNTNTIIRGNSIHDNNKCHNSSVGGIIVQGTATGTQIYNNFIYNNGSDARSGVANGIEINGPSVSGALVLNNTVYGNGSAGIAGSGIKLNSTGSPPTGTIIQNNLVVGNTTAQVADGGTGTVDGAGHAWGSQTTNRVTGVVTACTVSTSVFTQNASSTCFNAGFPASGHQYNDTNPDLGATEKITFATGSVETGDVSNLRLTFNNSAFPSLKPLTGIAGFTARKNSGSNIISGTCAVVGTNRIDCPLSTSVAFGDTIDASYNPVTGNVTDSALIGGTINQPLVQTLTNQSVTNNVGAGSSAVFTQTVFRFNGLRGTEAAPIATPYAAAPENTNILIVPGGSVRLRVGISCTSADCPPTGFIPLYSRNGGTYTIIPDTFGADNIAFCGTGPDPDIPNSGTSTTQQLTGSGTFAAGALVRTSNAIPTVDMALNGRTEIEWCLTTNSTVVATDIFQIRAFKQGSPATAIDGYSVTPKMTVTAAQAGRGF